LAKCLVCLSGTLHDTALMTKSTLFFCFYDMFFVWRFERVYEHSTGVSWRKDCGLRMVKDGEKDIMHSEEVDKSDGYRSLIPRSDKEAFLKLPIKFLFITIFQLAAQNHPSYNITPQSHKYTPQAPPKPHASSQPQHPTSHPRQMSLSSAARHQDTRSSARR
jgi:hypothetical protein